MKGIISIYNKLHNYVKGIHMEDIATLTKEMYDRFSTMNHYTPSRETFNYIMDHHGKEIISFIFNNPQKELMYTNYSNSSSSNIKTILYPYIPKYYPDFDVTVLFENCYVSIFNEMIRNFTIEQMTQVVNLNIKPSTAKRLAVHGDDNIRNIILDKFNTVDILRCVFRNTDDEQIQKRIYEIGIKLKSNKFIKTVAHHAIDNKVKAKAIMIKK